MKWLSVVNTFPKDGQLVWIMTNPHKKTVASLELHCGWVSISNDGKSWCINNMDENGYGSQCWYSNDDDCRCSSELIMAWIPANEFIYPAFMEELEKE